MENSVDKNPSLDTRCYCFKHPLLPVKNPLKRRIRGLFCSQASTFPSAAHAKQSCAKATELTQLISRAATPDTPVAEPEANRQNSCQGTSGHELFDYTLSALMIPSLIKTKNCLPVGLLIARAVHKSTD
jgi:hypothetical protein